MAARERVYLNGEILALENARISPLDRGFLYGDGFFETMRIHNGRAFMLGRHFARLDASLHASGFQDAVDLHGLADSCHHLIRANGVSTGRLRVTVSRGVLPGLAPDRPTRPTVFAQAAELKLDPPGRSGEIALGLSEHRISAQSRLASHKSLSYQANLLALSSGRRRGVDEVILQNAHGLLAEGAYSNLFFVRGGIVYTPHQRCGLLPGIARGIVLDLCRELGILSREGEYSPSDLWAAQEVFCTNSLRGIMPVKRIFERPSMHISHGAVTKALEEAYGALVVRECG